MTENQTGRRAVREKKGPGPAGDPKEAYVRKTWDSMGAVAHKVGGDNISTFESWEDIAQASRLKLWERLLGGMQTTLLPNAYAARIVENTARDAKRKSIRRPFTPVEVFTFRTERGTVYEPKPLLSGEPSSAEDEAMQRLANQGVIAMLKDLSPRQRVVVVLRDLEGLPELEVANILGIPKGTVRSNLSRAHKNLRGQLLKDGFERE